MTCALIDKDDILVGSAKSGCYRLTRTGDGWQCVHIPLLDPWVVSIARGFRSPLAGTFNGGLFSLAGEHGKAEALKAGEAGSHILSMACGEGKDLWTGTREGVFLLRDSDSFRLDRENSLLREAQVLYHEKGSLWAGTPYGILRMPSEWIRKRLEKGSAACQGAPGKE